VQFFVQKTLAIFFEYGIISISNEREETKEMSRTKKFLVLDTETMNSVEQPIPYDI
jgi:hypothetical protein